MAIVNVLQTDVFLGAINDSATFPDSPATSMSMQHHFASSNIWSYVYPLEIDIKGDDAAVQLWIFGWRDSSGWHAGTFHPGIFAKGCTQVNFGMFTQNCLVTAVFTSEFFG